MEDLGPTCRIHAKVPLCNLFGYVYTLPSLTEGKGTFAHRFSHFAPTPLPPDGPDDLRPAIGLRS